MELVNIGVLFFIFSLKNNEIEINVKFKFFFLQVLIGLLIFMLLLFNSLLFRAFHIINIRDSHILFLTLIFLFFFKIRLFPRHL